MANTFITNFFCTLVFEIVARGTSIAGNGCYWNGRCHSTNPYGPFPVTHMSRGGCQWLVRAPLATPVTKQVRCGHCGPWYADRVECPFFQTDQAVEQLLIAGPQPPCADKGVQSLSLSLSLSCCLSWIVPCANLRCFFYWPSGEQVLSLCSVPLVSCTTLQVFVTLGGGGGKEGSSLRVVRGNKAGGVFTAKDLAPIRKILNLLESNQ